MQETLIDIRTRRSCRKYLPEQITNAQLDAILEAATWTPTGRGKQSPQMVVVQDAEMLSKLSPVEIIPHLYYPFILGICAIVAIIIQRPRGDK